MSRAWYKYNGTDGFPAEGIITNYSLATLPLQLCVGGPHLCAIYALYNGDHPLELSERLKNYFAEAKIIQGWCPNGPNEKPYVYSRH